MHKEEIIGTIIEVIIAGCPILMLDIIQNGYKRMKFLPIYIS